MIRWYETLAAQIGLRLGGLAILSLAWTTAIVLYRHEHAHALSQASLVELSLCAIFFGLHVVGHALLFAGPGLWKQVPVAG
ncbi:MAG: hypothetical protein QM681_16645 [Novosphingobium sp.]